MGVGVPFQQWEYAVLAVDVVKVQPEWVFRARAWVGEREIYDKSRTESYWSAPLADLGRQGWELVGTSSENAVIAMGSNIPGWRTGERAYPVRMTFFLKRPLS